MLLRADLAVDLPEEKERLTDFTTRSCERIFTDAVREEGERARSRFLSMQADGFRAGWRTVRLRVIAGSEPLGEGHCRVFCLSRLNGEESLREEWIWNSDEETMLPPAQCRRFRKRASGSRRSSTKN